MKVTIVRGRAIVPSVNKVARALAQNGYDVKLLVWDRQSTLKPRGADEYTRYTFNLKAPYDTPTALFYVPFWCIYQFFFMLRHKADVVHACDLDTLLPAIAVKLVKRVKLCYTIYDFYARHLPDGRFLMARKLIRRIVASVERFGIRFTDALFLISESQYADVRRARIKKLAYIYNSPPDCLEGPPTREAMAGTETTIFYAGTLGKSRGLESIAAVVKGVQGVSLILGGYCPDKAFLNSLLDDKAEPAKTSIQYIGWLTYDEVLQYTLAADILFAFYDPNIPQNSLSSPNKLFEAMMARKPIIIGDGTWGARVVREEHCGLVVPYGDTQAIEGAVLKLKNDPDLRHKLGNNGRRAYEQKYSWRIMEQRLLDSYGQLENGAQSELEGDRSHA